jgi:hypothetical protein
MSDQPDFDLRGVVDMHVHYGPAAIPNDVSITHSVTAVEAARDAADAGLRAIVLKSKDYSTAALAHAVTECVPGVQVIGGVVLDHAVGGLNPVAVLQALRMGAKVVWLPTNGSRQDCSKNGPPEYLGSASDEVKRGISVIDDDGKIVPELHQIFEMLTEWNAVLATGHVSYDEHLAVAREFGSSGRLLATHCGARGGGPNLNAQQCTELAAYGTLMEFAALTCIDHWGADGMSMEEHTGMIRAVPIDQVVLSSDYGWDSALPRPVAGLQSYFEMLARAGFTEAELRMAACDTPARMLGLAG